MVPWLYLGAGGSYYNEADHALRRNFHGDQVLQTSKTQGFS